MTEPIVPSFDDAPAAESGASGGRKLTIICSKGNLDMVYPGLVLASAALGEGIETHMFFSFWGFDIITKSRMADLKFSMLGNTAMHMPQAPKLPLPAVMGAIPGVTRYATNMMKQQIADLEIPDVPEMIDTIKAMGGHLWGCRMSFDMNKLTEEDLYDDIDGIISASDFMEISEGGQIIFI